MVRSVVVGSLSFQVTPRWLMGLWGYVCGLFLVAFLAAFFPCWSVSFAVAGKFFAEFIPFRFLFRGGVCC